jgi:hypothetical protein
METKELLRRVIDDASKGWACNSADLPLPSSTFSIKTPQLQKLVRRRHPIFGVPR